MRSLESLETAETMKGFEGENDVLYVQLPMGRVLSDWFRVGDHYQVRVSQSVALRHPAHVRHPYLLHRPIPRARYKGVLLYGVPAHGKCLPLVLVIVHHREVVDTEVKQLDGAIATRNKELVLVDFGPCEVILRIVRIISGHRSL